MKKFRPVFFLLFLQPLFPEINSSTYSFSRARNTAKMPYPENATGFMIEDQKDWQNFKKQEVRKSITLMVFRTTQSRH